MNELSPTVISFLTSGAFWLTFLGFVRLRYPEKFLSFEKQAESHIEMAMKRESTLYSSALGAARASYFNLFGKNDARIFLSSLVLTVISITSLWIIVWPTSSEIDSANSKITEFIKIEIPEFHDYLLQEGGSEKVHDAFAQTCHRGGCYFTNKDEESTRIRKSFHLSHNEVLSLVQSHGLDREYGLHMMFGEALVNPAWMERRKSQVVASSIVIFVIHLLIDFLVLRLLFMSLKRPRFFIFGAAASVALCAISIFDYLSFFYGARLLAFDTLLFFIAPLLGPLFINLWDSSRINERIDYKIRILYMIYFSLCVYLLWDFWDVRIFSAVASIASMDLVSSKSAVAASFVTVMPLILILSFFFAVLISLGIFRLLELLTLSHLVGIKVVAGGTYAFGCASILTCSCTIIISIFSLFQG